MLFKSLIDRFLGGRNAGKSSKRNHAQICKPSLGKRPDLLHAVLRLLKAGDSPSPSGTQLASGGQGHRAHAESVFPALQILQKASVPADYLPAVRLSVFNLAGSPHWHIRDMAARTVPALFEYQDPLETVEQILKLPLIEQNTLHGALLSVRYIVRVSIEDFLNEPVQAADSPMASTSSCVLRTLQNVFSCYSGFFHMFYEKNQCAFTRASYLDIINDFGELMLVRSDFEGKSHDCYCVSR